MWDLATLADQIIASIADTELALQTEQAVRGLDMLPERGIQLMLANALSKHYDVAREMHYPSSAGKALSHRLRCDLVITPPDGAGQPLWIEIKAAWQFREGGLRHRGYSSAWRTRTVQDLRKMQSEPGIQDAMFLLVVFCDSDETLQKDLAQFGALLYGADLLAGHGHTRQISIQDRIGHNVCCIALWPIVQKLNFEV